MPAIRAQLAKKPAPARCYNRDHSAAAPKSAPYTDEQIDRFVLRIAAALTGQLAFAQMSARIDELLSAAKLLPPTH